MQIPSIKRTDPDVIYLICRNSEASADMANSEWVEWDITTTAGRLQGVDVIKTTGVSLRPAGCVSGTIKNMAFGRVQCFGYHRSAKTTAAALAAGTILTTDAAAACVAGAVGDDPNARVGVCLTLGANNLAGVMIRCM